MSQWGLQKERDMWQLAWQAVTSIGSANQTLRKVKGHATISAVQEGTSNHKDKVGNHISDGLADKGVQSIDGIGLVRLGKWIADKHDRYTTFIRRIHSMIAGVHLAENTQRGYDARVEKAVLGYDPTKWTDAKAFIRDESSLNIAYNQIRLPPPFRGKHK